MTEQNNLSREFLEYWKKSRIPFSGKIEMTIITFSNSFELNKWMEKNLYQNFFVLLK